MSEPETTSAGAPLDAPNKQVLGLDPPWVEGTGGEGGEATPKATATGETDLDSMSKEELLEHAQSLGVSPANKNMTKEELRESIDAQSRAGSD